jgi:hypothetical protein
VFGQVPVFGNLAVPILAPEGDGAWLSSTHILEMAERCPSPVCLWPGTNLVR